MPFFKKLITGKYSLAVTFFIAWFIPLTAAAFVFQWIEGANYFTPHTVVRIALPFTIFMLIICVSAISSIIFMLKAQITALRILALVLVVIDFSYRLYDLQRICTLLSY